ncbi:hypothetical protein KY337_02720 [Candidatus Woesearchaeota archaeon]|nr:hypothetical protein [Candidatus Woesearchaeota archaeon]
MKKSVYLVLMLLLIGVVCGLSSFTNSGDVVLTFTGDSYQSTDITLPGNAYVLSATMTFNGQLSEWEVVTYYSFLNDPVSGKHINPDAWLITDEDTDAVYLIQPSSNTSLKSTAISLSDPTDALYYNDELWFISDSNNNRVILYNVTSDSVEWTYSVTDPSDVDIIENTDLILVSSWSGAHVLLINTTSGQETGLNITSNIGAVYDAEYLSTDLWLVADNSGGGRIKAMDPNTDTILWQYAITEPRDIDYLGDNLTLIASNSIPNSLVFQFNMSNGEYLLNYSDVTEPRDAEVVTDFEWLITDKSGTRKVSLVKKYYPTNPTLDITNDSDIEWTGPAEFSAVATVNDADGFSDELNDYLDLLDDDNTNHSVPLVFHSDTSGVINITNVNVVYNQKPNLTITSPNGGEYWSGVNNISWDHYDDDNGLLNVTLYYWNVTSSQWDYLDFIADLPIGPQNYSWNTVAFVDDNNYLIGANVTDGINSFWDESDSDFTIDNSIPGIVIDMDDVYYRNDVSVYANATDNYGINLVNATIECPGESPVTMVLENVSAIRWQNVTSLINFGSGTCTVTVDAQDLAGNVNTTTKTFDLKIGMELSIQLSNSNPNQNAAVSAYGYVYYDNGTLADNNTLVNVSYLSTDYATTTNASGYYTTSFTATSSGTVYAYVYENGETFSNSTSLTVQTGGGGGGGGGGGSTSSCGDSVCELNRETCSSCPKDCGECPPVGMVSLVVPDNGPSDSAFITEGEQDEEGEEKNSGIVEQVPDEPLEILEPEPVEDNLAAGMGFGVFTDFLKNPRTLIVFAIIVAIIATLLLTGFKKRKKEDFLKEFGD